MNNKKFGIIYALLILIIIILVVFSAFKTLKKEDTNISIDDLNNIINESYDFKSSKMKEITLDNLNELFGINSSDINKVYGKKSVLGTDSSMYILINSNNNEEILNMLQEFGNKYQDEWSDYLESEYDKVLNRECGISNDFVYFIVSNDAYDIVKNIKK